MFIHEPLFEIDPPTESTYEPEELWFILDADGQKVCPHCGESGGFITNDHGKVFNGWCAKRLFLNGRAKWRNQIVSGEIKRYLDPKQYDQKRYGQKWIDEITEMNNNDIGWLNSKGFDLVDEHDERNWA